MAGEGAIGALIVDHPLCLECIAEKVNTRPADVDEALTLIAKVTQVSVVPRSICRDCQQMRVTFCIGEGAGTATVTLDGTQGSRPQHCAWCGTVLAPEHEVRVQRSVLYHRICLDVRERILSGRSPEVGDRAF